MCSAMVVFLCRKRWPCICRQPVCPSRPVSASFVHAEFGSSVHAGPDRLYTRAFFALDRWYTQYLLLCTRRTGALTAACFLACLSYEHRKCCVPLSPVRFLCQPLSILLGVKNVVYMFLHCGLSWRGWPSRPCSTDRPVALVARWPWLGVCCSDFCLCLLGVLGGLLACPRSALAACGASFPP